MFYRGSDIFLKLYCELSVLIYIFVHEWNVYRQVRNKVRFQQCSGPNVLDDR